MGGLDTLCRFVGRKVDYACRSTGRIMNLFLGTCAVVPQADPREVLRQMSRLGADSLPIVSMTSLCTGMVLSVQTAKEFVRFGAADSVGGIVAIAMGRELSPILTGVVVAGRIGAAIAAEIGTMKVTEQIDALRVMAHNENVYAYNFEGKRYDTGDKLGYLKATVEFALRRDDLGPAFREYLKELAEKE